MTRQEARYRIAEQVLARQAGAETILLSMTSETYFALKGSGSRVWALLSERGSSSAQNLVDVLAQEFDVEHSVLDADVTAMLGSLLRHGLVVET